MRRLAALVLGGVVLLPPVTARAGEPDPEKVARIIEQIRAYRAEKERTVRRAAPTPGPTRKSDPFPRDVRRQTPREAPRPAPTGGRDQ